MFSWSFRTCFKGEGPGRGRPPAGAADAGAQRPPAAEAGRPQQAQGGSVGRPARALPPIVPEDKRFEPLDFPGMVKDRYGFVLPDLVDLLIKWLPA